MLTEEFHMVISISLSLARRFLRESMDVIAGRCRNDGIWAWAEGCVVWSLRRLGDRMIDQHKDIQSATA